MSNNDTFESVKGGIDTKFIMEALTNDVKRMFRVELEQFHKRVEQNLEQPRNPPIGRRREKFPRRGVQLEEEEYEGDGFEDEIVRDSIVRVRRHGGRLREVRSRQDNNLGSIKMKIPSFQGKNDP